MNQKISFLSLLLFLLFFFSLEPEAQEPSSADILNSYSQRQTECMQEVADNVDAATSIRGLATLFLEKDAPAANAMLAEFDEDDSVFISVSLFLRALMTYHDKETILFSETRSRMEKHISKFILNNEKALSPLQENNRMPENQEILQNACYLLWAQYIQDATIEFTWPDKASNSNQLKRYTQKTSEWLEIRLKYGLEDRSSPYYFYELAALANLFDYAKDAKIKKNAQNLMDLTILEIAQESIRGEWGGVHCRSFENLMAIPGNRFHYLNFGIDSNQPGVGIDPATMHFAHSSYHPLSLATALGKDWDRRGIFEIKNSYCKDLNKPDKKDLGYKYSYVTPDFILGSYHLRDENVPDQSRPWDLLLFNDNEPIHFFTFLGEQLFSGGRPPFKEDYYQWNCTALQYKNVLFCQYQRADRITPSANAKKERITHRFVQLPTRVWLPDMVAEALTQEEDWWFCQFNNLYIAFRPLGGRSYWWRTAAVEENPQSTSAIMAFQDLQTGFLIEVDYAAEFSSYETFKKQVLTSPLVISNQSVSYVSRKGDVFLFPLGDNQFQVNGKPFSPPEDPSFQYFSSPFIQSDFGSSLYKAVFDKETMVWDLRQPQSAAPQVISATPGQ